MPGPVIRSADTREAIWPTDGDESFTQSGRDSLAGGSISRVGTCPRNRQAVSSRSYSSRQRVHPSVLIMNFMRLRCLCS
jgi:hypothetical protein